MVKLRPRVVCFGWINLVGWAEPEGMKVYVPFLMLASLLLVSIPLTAQLPGR